MDRTGSVSGRPESMGVGPHRKSEETDGPQMYQSTQRMACRSLWAPLSRPRVPSHRASSSHFPFVGGITPAPNQMCLSWLSIYIAGNHDPAVSRGRNTLHTLHYRADVHWHLALELALAFCSLPICTYLVPTHHTRLIWKKSLVICIDPFCGARLNQAQSLRLTPEPVRPSQCHPQIRP